MEMFPDFSNTHNWYNATCFNTCMYFAFHDCSIFGLSLTKNTFKHPIYFLGPEESVSQGVLSTGSRNCPARNIESIFRYVELSSEEFGKFESSKWILDHRGSCLLRR
uniref:Uncharacterized protein n=1 Tax=Spongospora subterranea TaxID=70186 RepID=A0A0H5QQ14_9EUKA|eukprot:CRZ03521.1 hypothetical protein [Spongospora subterranea]